MKGENEMSEILDGNYKMNKFPIGSVIERSSSYFVPRIVRLVVDFETTADGVGMYTVEYVGNLNLKGIRSVFTQEYIESKYRLEEGEESEN